MRARLDGACELILLAAVAISPYLCVSMGAQQIQQPDSGAKVFAVPSGTPVAMRFVRPVLGYPWAVAVHKGHRVRLVVAEDVVIDNKVVIAKGGMAQAVVEDSDADSGLARLFSHPEYNAFMPFRLELQWVETVNRVRVPLSPIRQQAAGAFYPALYVVGNSLVAIPLGFRKQSKFKAPKACDQSSIPAGTRLTAYVVGDIDLDRGTIDEAQVSVPPRNEMALLNVFRDPKVGPGVRGKVFSCGKTKRSAEADAGLSPDLFCDEQKLGPLEAQQYRIVELAPGRHSCRVAGSQALELGLAAGGEYYLRLSRSKRSQAWELQAVNSLEGEDGVSACVPAQ